MATGRVLLGSLLLLILQLDLGGNPGTSGAPVEDEGLLSQPVGDRGTQRPQLGKDPQNPMCPPNPAWTLPAVSCPLSCRHSLAQGPGQPVPAVEPVPACG